MGQNYGVSFATKLIEDGKYEEAIVAAGKHAEQDLDDPEPHLDRAIALFNLERFDDAVTAIEQSLKLDEEAQTLETDLVDDTLFGALLGQARRLVDKDVPGALAQLARYGKILPTGRHSADVGTWSARFRGEGVHDVIVKERL